jgi:2-polyprenyl-3-methyl-5-hydroxy-6-metoxy-1,4-benzoquinol methylase
MSSGPTNEDVRRGWDAVASYWDEQMRAGRTWQREYIAPAVEDVLLPVKGERILELACGNGEFARRLTELGATVVATDFSSAMIEVARGHGRDIDYRLVDATDEDALRAIGPPSSFDAIVSNMAIMDMLDIQPLAKAAIELVRPGGRFVVSALHPAFNSGYAMRVTEESADDSGVRRTHWVKTSRYRTPFAAKGIALEGQPTTQWYFHRPLEMILEPFFANGWIVDALREPVLASSQFFSDVPGILVVRFRRPG